MHGRKLYEFKNQSLKNTSVVAGKKLAKINCFGRRNARGTTGQDYY
jgi:hypothetical protein